MSYIEDESVDPRVRVELEKLNTATELINQLEIELDEARTHFRILLSDSTQKITSHAKKIGTSIEKAQPYYAARAKAKQIQGETQRAALRFERANSALIAAKEMVQLAEDGLNKNERTFDSARQEMLNHATQRVNEAKSECINSEKEHARTSAAYNGAEKKVLQLHQELRKSISRSRSYFELKAQFSQALEDQRKKINQLEEKVLKVKLNYSQILSNLEQISDEIHQKRKIEEIQFNEERSEGVGAESPVTVIENTENSCLERSEKLPMYEVPFQDANDNMNLQIYISSNSTPPFDKVEELSLKCNLQKNEVRQQEKHTTIPTRNTQEIKNDTNHELPTSKPYSFDSGKENVHGRLLSTRKQFANVQLEDYSDTDSLKSTDTADTLDDNQVDCLFQDKYFDKENIETVD